MDASPEEIAAVEAAYAEMLEQQSEFNIELDRDSLQMIGSEISADSSSTPLDVTSLQPVQGQPTLSSEHSGSPSVEEIDFPELTSDEPALTSPNIINSNLDFDFDFDKEIRESTGPPTQANGVAPALSAPQDLTDEVLAKSRLSFWKRPFLTPDTAWLFEDKYCPSPDSALLCSPNQYPQPASPQPRARPVLPSAPAIVHVQGQHDGTYLSNGAQRRSNTAPVNATTACAKPLQKPTHTSKDLAHSSLGYQQNPIYTPLPNPPQPWDIFTYTLSGELDPAQLYTPTEITRYLLSNPHSLTLRIHRNPAKSRARFPTTLSHRCRFTTCPATHNTINQGHACVAFDELSTTTPNHDPFLNAAYVHLYCLERFCDFPLICSTLPTVAETRKLPKEHRGVNRMGFASVAEEKAVTAFIANCRHATLSAAYPRHDGAWRYEGTLCHSLAIIKLRSQMKGTIRQREARVLRAGYRGATMDSHLGDLEAEAEIRGKTRLHRNQTRHYSGERKGRARAWGGDYIGEDDEEEEEEEGDCEGLDGEDAAVDVQMQFGALPAHTLALPRRRSDQVSTYPPHTHGPAPPPPPRRSTDDPTDDYLTDVLSDLGKATPSASPSDTDPTPTTDLATITLQKMQLQLQILQSKEKIARGLQVQQKRGREEAGGCEGEERGGKRLRNW